MKKVEFQTRAGMRLFAILALVSGLAMLRQAHWYDPATFGHDALSAFESHIDPVRAALPDHGTIGYVSDPVPDNDPNLLKGHAREFFWTQYALAPLIVTEGNQYPFVIGNFHQPVSPQQIVNMHMKLIKDFGNGVMLFRNTGQ